MFFVLFAKLGHQTMTFVASEQRLRKHMNTTTLSTTTQQQKDNVVFYAIAGNLAIRVFSRFLLLTLLCQTMREVERTRDHVQKILLAARQRDRLCNFSCTVLLHKAYKENSPPHAVGKPPNTVTLVTETLGFYRHSPSHRRFRKKKTHLYGTFWN